MDFRGLLLLAALPLAACGPCHQIASHRDSFRAEAPAEADAAHLRLEIPEAMVDGWLTDAARALPVADFRLPGLGDLSRYLGRFSLATRRIAMKADRDDGVTFEIDFDLKDGNRTIFGMALGAKAPVQYDEKKRELRVSLRADLFDKVKPRLPGDAAGKLTDALYAQVPGIARGVLDKRTIGGLVNRAMDEIVDRAYALLRNEVLKPVGEIAAFKVTLPDVPIAGLALSSEKGGAVRLDIRSALPAAGLPRSAASSKAAGDAIKMQVSTDFMVALGNWAMARGELPAQYDKDGKPQKDGPFTAGLDWNRGDRPLKVHLWQADATKNSGICLRARAGGTPHVAWQEGNLSVGFDDARIEELEGPPFVSLAASVMGIGDRTFDYTKKVATATELSFGSGKQKVSLQSVRLDPSALLLELRVGEAKKGKPRS